MATIKSEMAYIDEAKTNLRNALISKFGIPEASFYNDTEKTDPKRLHDWVVLVNNATVTTSNSITFTDKDTSSVAIDSPERPAEPGSSFNGSESLVVNYHTVGAFSDRGGELFGDLGSLSVTGDGIMGIWDNSEEEILTMYNNSPDGLINYVGSYQNFSDISEKLPEDLSNFVMLGIDTQYLLLTNGGLTFNNSPVVTMATLPLSDWNQADSTEPDYIKNKPGIPRTLDEISDGSTRKLLTIGTTASTAAAGNHAHGNISNSGTISSTAVTPTTSDYILIADYSNNGKIERAFLAATTVGSASGASDSKLPTEKAVRDAIEASKTPDTKVTQTGGITSSETYELLLSKSANDTTETDTVQKTSRLRYNPGALTLINGGCAQQYDSENNCLRFIFN